MYLQIDITPDYNITPYQRGDAAYYFRSEWNFAGKFSYAISISIEDSRIYTETDINHLSEEFKLTKFEEDGTYSKFLSELRTLDIEQLYSYGFPTNFGQVELQTLRINSIDNVAKKVLYEGSYLADAGEVEMGFFPFYSYIAVKAVPLQMDSFYKDLIAEGYLLFLQGNFKLSYFLLYSAIENYIKQVDSTLKGQITQLVAKIGLKRFGVEGSTIFKEFIENMKGKDKIRNDIAHGNHFLEISRSTVLHLLDNSLVLICSVELNITELRDLHRYLKSKAKP
jgi:hypothetical protein